ncbi:hypothetical protein D3C86_747630 [compost metagenome]
MKPSHTPARTGVLRSLRASSKPVATVSGAVCSPTTISSSFMMLAGEKKCSPSTLPGFRVAVATRFTSR